MNSLGSRHWFTQLGQKSILCLVAMAPSNQPFIHSDRAMASSITFPYNYASCRNRFKRRGAVCGWFLHSVSSRQPQSIHTRKFIRFFFFYFISFFLEINLNIEVCCIAEGGGGGGGGGRERERFSAVQYVSVNALSTLKTTNDSDFVTPALMCYPPLEQIIK